MSKRRLLVTGSRGFVGSVLLAAARERFGDDAFEIKTFSDPSDGRPVDLADGDAVDRAVAAAEPDIVIHLAAIAAPRDARSQPQRAWQVNVMGTFHLAQAVLRHTPKARFVWAGSSEAYGAAFNRSPAPISEDATLEPTTPYGATKAAADLMLRQLARDGLDVVAFRPFNHTGAGQAATYVVPAFAEQIARIEAGLQAPVLKVGNLEAWRDFLDVRDVVRAYLSAGFDRDAGGAGEAYNLSRGTPVQIRAILDRLTAMARVPIAVETDPGRYFPNDVPVAAGNAGKAAREIGWQAEIPLDETLEGVLAAFRRALG